MTSIPQPGSIANSGNPIFVSELKIDGVSGNSALPEQLVQLITKIAITSDSPMFYPIAQGLSAVLDPLIGNRLHRGEYVLVVIKQDRSAQIWFNTVAVAHEVIMKRNATIGMAVFQQDIVDVQAMKFPCVEIETTDQVIVMFQEQWRYAIYFDFNPDRALNLSDLWRNLGTLYRSLAYRNHYDLMSDSTFRQKLINTGWFPFAEISQSEFKDLAQCISLGGKLAEAENKVIESFTRERLNRLLERWEAKPSFAQKKIIFSSGIDAFLRKDPVASIKTMLTEIEGILNSEHEVQQGRRLWRLDPLLDFAITSAERKAGSLNTLLFPEAFKEYLLANAFANFDPRDVQDAEASSRHAVSHGAAKAESYTVARALQVILTLDQLLFYL